MNGPQYALRVRIHLALRDEHDLPLGDATFESPLLSIGGNGEVDDFVIEGLPAHAIEIRVVGRHLRLSTRAGGQDVSASAIVPLAGGRTLRVTPYPDPITPREGDCPRCAHAVKDVALGGAYRTMARRERACERCGGVILDLDATAIAIGAFADESRHEWVQIQAPIVCGRCRQPMTRAVFTTAHGRAQVERCVPCGVVFLEPPDRARLRGQT